MRKASSIDAGSRVLVQLFLIGLVIASLLPLYNVIAASFKSADEFVANPFFLPRAPTVDNYVYAAISARLLRFAVNSLILVPLRLLLYLAVCVSAGYAFGKMRFRPAAPVPPRALSHDLSAAPPGHPGVQADFPAAPDEHRPGRHPHVGGLLLAVRHLHHDHVFRRTCPTSWLRPRAWTAPPRFGSW